jgi:hypothetical protein
LEKHCFFTPGAHGEKVPQPMIENDEQAYYWAMRWSIKYEMKLTKPLGDINNKAAAKLRPEQIFVLW